MLKPICSKYNGIITISGPTRSGKSQLAEYLIKDQISITYIATSKVRENDPQWTKRIKIHRERRPSSWKVIEHPNDICKTINSLGKNEAILLDSLGGLVEQHIMEDDLQWKLFQHKFVKCLKNKAKGCIFIVSEEVGWGLVPATPIGHLFRERHCEIFLSLSRIATKKWLAVNGTAIDLNQVGYPIP